MFSQILLMQLRPVNVLKTGFCSGHSLQHLSCVRYSNTRDTFLETYMILKGLNEVHYFLH